MTARVSHTTIDCRDAYTLSEWWKGVLDYVDVEGDPNLAGHEECMILSRDGSHRLLFIEVPETKSGKNRIHLDLEPVAGRRDDELARLLAHGDVDPRLLTPPIGHPAGSRPGNHGDLASPGAGRAVGRPDRAPERDAY